MRRSISPTSAPGDESPFVVTIPNVADVARYRVSFRTEAGTLRHVDRRADAAPGLREVNVMRTIPRSLIAVALAASAAATLAAQNQEGFSFRSGVELINVTATVTDEDGRFVSGLRKEDFTVYEDGAAPGSHPFQQRARAGEPRHRRSTRAAA